MSHASRKIAVTTKGTTSWKKIQKHYAAKTVEYGYPQDSTDQTQKALAAAAKSYKSWLKGEVADEREMLHLSLDQNHRIKND